METRKKPHLAVPMNEVVFAARSSVPLAFGRPLRIEAVSTPVR
ncbi:hypothetical protein [Corallococcus caeni]